VSTSRARPEIGASERYRPSVPAIADGTGSGLRDASVALDRAFEGVRVKAGKGVPHAHEVATVLGEVGCSEPVQVAGLLHDIVEDTAWTVGDVSRSFGSAVAALVAALTEDDRIASYRRRKKALREQIAIAGPAAIDIALADKIASLRYAMRSGKRVAQRKVVHYEATLAMTPRAAHPELGAEAGRLLAAVAGRDGSALTAAPAAR
jgi:(p)ppGpp synthase/HD superfamily hydrolase